MCLFRFWGGRGEPLGDGVRLTRCAGLVFWQLSPLRTDALHTDRDIYRFVFRADSVAIHQSVTVTLLSLGETWFRILDSHMKASDRK